MQRPNSPRNLHADRPPPSASATEIREYVGWSKASEIRQEDARRDSDASNHGGLTDENRAVIEALFHDFDEDGGGTISINEMLQHESMAEFDEEEVKAMFASVDSDSSGELDLQAFTQMVEDMNIFDSFIDVLHKQKKKKQGRRDSTTRRPSLADLATMRKMADRWSAEDDDGW